LQDKGYKASDIAILIRRRSEGALIVETFMEASDRLENSDYNLSVLSNESLFLYASRGITMVVLVIEQLTDSDDNITMTALLHLWLSWLKPLQIALEEKDETHHNRGFEGFIISEADVLSVYKSELKQKIKLIEERASLLSLD